MPGPGKACLDDYTDCKPVPGGGPADHPASHGGKLVHARHNQVDQYQDERDPPVKERAHPAARQRTRGALAKLARVLRLLCRCMPRATGIPGSTKYAPLPIGWSDGTPRVLLGAECACLAGCYADVG